MKQRHWKNVATHELLDLGSETATHFFVKLVNTSIKLFYVFFYEHPVARERCSILETMLHRAAIASRIFEAKFSQGLEYDDAIMHDTRDSEPHN